jgi:hypothetical protein
MGLMAAAKGTEPPQGPFYELKESIPSLSLLMPADMVKEMFNWVR